LRDSSEKVKPKRNGVEDMTKEQLEEEIKNQFRGFAPDVCNQCGEDLTRNVICVEDSFAKANLRLFEQYCKDKRIVQVVEGKLPERIKWVTLKPVRLVE